VKEDEERDRCMVNIIIRFFIFINVMATMKMIIIWRMLFILGMCGEKLE